MTAKYKAEPGEEPPKKRDLRKKYAKLPNHLVHIPNADKSHNEHWYKGRGIADFPRPYRMLLCGAPGSGKTNALKNILLRQKWDEMYIVHVDPESREWLDFEIPAQNQFEDIPDVSVFDHDSRKLLIIEDYEFKSKAKQGPISKLFRYASTHKNLTLALLYQDYFSVPTIVRRCSNVFVVWSLPDASQLNMLGRRLGLEKGELPAMLEELCPHHRDSLCFDMTEGTPYPLRKNIFQPVKKIAAVDVEGLEGEYEIPPN